MSTVLIDQKLKSKLADVLSRFPVTLAYLYGSQAVGQATPLSDVDIALLLEEGSYDTANRLKLELQIEDEIVQNCNLSKADVRVINQAPLLVHGEVVTSGVLLYSCDEGYD